MPYEPSDPRMLDRAMAIGRGARAAIMPFYRRGAEVCTTTGSSPVTAPDEAADSLIARALRELTPCVPAVSEESAAQFEGKAPADAIWLVDRPDETRSFISERDEFTVDDALVRYGESVPDVISLPTRDEPYAGASGRGTWVIVARAQRPIRRRPGPTAGTIIAAGRSHGDGDADGAQLLGIKVDGEVQAGSASKVFLISRGAASVCPRSGRTLQRETPAGQALIEAAGGQPLVYGKSGLDDPLVLASSAPKAH